MKKVFSLIALSLVILLAGYFLWAYTGRTPPSVIPDLHLDSSFVINANVDKGNVIGINAYMEPSDYATKEHFYAKLDGYLQECKRQNWLTPKTVVVFPEYIGAWLVVEGEKKSIYTDTTIDKALTTFVTSNFFRYIASWFMSPDSAMDKIKHAVFAFKGNRMARIYSEVFSALAKKYSVTIIGGSILLQNPMVKKNKIIVKNGSLENITAVFNPDGSLQPTLTRKAFPIEDELPFVIRRKSSELPVYDLPIGKTAVMICADSWYPISYETIQQSGLTFIAVPAYTRSDHTMDSSWKGYSGSTPPTDVNTDDIGKITLQDAWLKYSMPARIQKTNIPFGMTISLRGKLWDLGSDGEWMIYNKGQVQSPKYREGASMICLWLN